MFKMRLFSYYLKTFFVLLFGISVFGIQTIQAQDTDMDGIPDNADLDDDNDGILDSVECLNFTTSLAGTWVAITPGADVNDIDPLDVFLVSNIFTFSGTDYDLKFQLISNTDTSETVRLTATGLELGNNPSPNNDDRITYEITFVESGTVTSGDLIGTPFTPSEMQITVFDLDSNPNVSNQWTDIGGFITPTTNVIVGSLLSPYTIGGDVVYGLTTFPNQDTSNSPDYAITGVFDSQSTIRMIHGVTGTTSTSSNNRGAVLEFVILDCNIPDTDLDGIPNSLDLDSDGDGCPDAVEGSLDFRFVQTNASPVIPGGNSGANYIGTATTGVSNNLTGDYGGSSNPVADGYVDSSGRVLEFQDGTAIAGAPVNQIEDISINPIFQNCSDCDSDTVSDLEDLDDDNDGILDTEECDFFDDQAARVGSGNTNNPQTYSFDSGAVTLNISTDTGVFLTGSGNQWRFNETSIGQGTYTLDFGVPVFNVRLRVNSVGTTSGGVLNTATPGIDFAGQALFGNFEATLVDTSTISNMKPLIFPAGAGFDPETISTTEIGGATYITDPTSNSTQASGNIGFAELSVGQPITRLTFENIGDGIGPTLWVQVFASACSDVDNDAILSYKDLDSDGDGCSDAVEGGDAILNSQLLPSSMDGGNTVGAGTFTGFGGPITDNLTGNYGGASDPVTAGFVDTSGRVTQVDGGAPPGTSPVAQSLSESQDVSLYRQCCDVDAPTLTPN